MMPINLTAEKNKYIITGFAGTMLGTSCTSGCQIQAGMFGVYLLSMTRPALADFSSDCNHLFQSQLPFNLEDILGHYFHHK